MFETKTIAVSKGIPLQERISEVSKQVSEWLDSFEKLSDAERNSLRLKKADQTSKEFRYHYSISTGAELTASKVRAEARTNLRPS